MNVFHKQLVCLEKRGLEMQVQNLIFIDLRSHESGCCIGLFELNPLLLKASTCSSYCNCFSVNVCTDTNVLSHFPIQYGSYHYDNK